MGKRVQVQAPRRAKGGLDTTIQNESNLVHEAIRYYSTRAAGTETTRAKTAATTTAAAAKASRIG
jgi:hypothetical protein